MDDSDRTKVLKQWVTVWKEWQGKNPDIQIDPEEAINIESHHETQNLHGKNLDNADLRNKDFTWATLAESNLSGSDLSGTSLLGANLIEADLMDVDLSAADLAGANLSGANLLGAELCHANLSFAKLNNADLCFSDFYGAKLDGADFSGAICHKVIFGDTDLSGVKGLENVIHRGPSSIDINTLFNSKGKIPEIFLRGAGVPEILIKALPSLLSEVSNYSNCKIICGRNHQTFAKNLQTSLQNRGVRCWIPKYKETSQVDIFMNEGTGESLDDDDDGWNEFVTMEFEFYDKILFCLTEECADNIAFENILQKYLDIERQLNKEDEANKQRVIFLDVDGNFSKNDHSMKIQNKIKTRLVASFDGYKDSCKEFDGQISNVVQALRTC
jgi:uncharacterized protein YjbI with pentapeptide repeats